MYNGAMYLCTFVMFLSPLFLSLSLSLSLSFSLLSLSLRCTPPPSTSPQYWWNMRPPLGGPIEAWLPPGSTNCKRKWKQVIQNACKRLLNYKVVLLLCIILHVRTSYHLLWLVYYSSPVELTSYVASTHVWRFIKASNASFIFPVAF